ncbi:hypothetical protein [Ornithobacterium rhinotracheale]|uniref:hypothetical protein n=1 Tax=Ornithobacterium rhinotracheale TaxID=28251 RepID=UPI001FF23CDD|nr:hypothetical protein [Ornithobacterium rhinotracheale]MCK0199214.1 hypothetical protein [Ornithobacterium rhinotracheale]MCK0200277.1 hypothetical protein [Ornithobacterium rhinotracheale]
MAYNRLNFLKKVLEMQELVLRVQNEYPDLYLKEIYWRYVEPRYLISYRTFHNWLGINAKYEIKKYEP